MGPSAPLCSSINWEYDGSGILLSDAVWGSTVDVHFDDGNVHTLRWGKREGKVEYMDIWDPASGQITQTLEGHEKAVNCVEISPDGSQLASASDDGTVRVIWKCISSFLACLECSQNFFAHLCRSGISLPAKLRKLWRVTKNL